MKSSLLCLFLFAFCAKLNAQIHIEFLEQSDSKDFNEIVQQVEAYFQDKDKGRGSGYKQFKRWEYYHSSRLSINGTIVDVSQRNFDEFYSYQQNNQSIRGKSVVAGDWESVGPTSYSSVASGHAGGLGRVNCIEVDPVDSNILYIGTPGGGLWKSTNGGSSWQALTDGIPRIGISDIVIDPTSPPNNRTIYILTGDGNGVSTPSVGVLKSMDNGVTWYSTGLTGADLGRPYKLTMHPSNSNVLFVADFFGIFRSDDGGLSWTETIGNLTDSQFYDIEFIPNHPDIILASARNGIYKSVNGGGSWFPTAFGTPPTGTTRIELAVTNANENYVYAICGGNWTATPNPQIGFNGVYRSEDYGLSYFRQSIEPNILGESSNGQDLSDQSWYDLAIAVSPSDKDEVHVGGINCWGSLNGGETWGNTSYWVETDAGAGNYTHADIHDLVFAGSTLYCVSDGGVYKSTDKAANWINISNGLQIAQVYRLGMGYKDDGTTTSDLYFGAQDNGLNALRFPNSTSLHWEGGDGFEVIQMLNPWFVLGETQYGRLWFYYGNTSVEEVTPTNQKGAWLTPLASISYGETNRIIAGYEDVFLSPSHVYTKLSSQNWSNITNGDLGTSKCTHIAVAPSDQNYLYVSKGRQIYRTTNLGSSWTNIKNNLPNAIINYFAIHPTNPNTVYAITGDFFEGQKVFRTTNGGTNWTNISGTLPNVPVNCIVYENESSNGLYIGTDVGVFYRDDNLGDWVPFYHNLPNVEVTELEINYSSSKLYASTYGRGIWKTDLYGKSCAENEAISQNLEGFKYFTANNITTTSTVEPFADVNLVAASSISLFDGFRTLAESNFNAKIDADVCSEGISARFSKTKIGTYAGPLPAVIGVVSSDFKDDLTSNANELYLFPNPSNGHYTVTFEDPTISCKEIRVFNSLGQQVLLKKVADPTIETLLDISSQPANIYYASFYFTNGEVITKKLIKE